MVCLQHLDKEFREAPATKALAQMFGVPAGTMLLERRFVFHFEQLDELDRCST
ncbi:hypothetical protein [Micromonospora sp. KC606]|uniref:hypothetical protein n=1 Tax=Micromonospora sp. KC606 TaxID=2530379 RepID=UPI001404AD6F|nr:hypothetical protein [Micromonospora sp. KC606]